MMKKKLQLHRVTLRLLTMPVLAEVVGGAGGPSLNAGMQSIKVDTKIEPCQRD